MNFIFLLMLLILDISDNADYFLYKQRYQIGKYYGDDCRIPEHLILPDTGSNLYLISVDLYI